MRGTVKKIIDFITEHQMLRPGMKVLCAVSGGADSMFLLYFLNKERERFGITIAAAHYEHGIREGESERDAAFVADYCDRNGILCVCEHGDVPAYALENRLNLEEAARECRYAFLNRCADSFGCEVIAIAHNLEDNAETMLFHLARGSGLKGLCGIPPKNGRVIRPLLAVSRREIEDCLREENIPWVTDSSNTSDSYSRNRLRHHVAPELQQINPAFSEAMLRTAELLRRDEETLTALAENFIRQQFDGSSISAAALCDQPFAVASRVIRLLCPRPLSANHVESILALTQSTELGFADVPGLRVRCDRGRLFFGHQEKGQIPEIEITPGMDLILPESGIRVVAETFTFSEKVHALLIPFCIKCGEIYGRVKMSSRHSGDVFRPAGRGCTKSLKKYFLELGLTQSEREAVPVIRDGRGVLGIYGYALDERAVPKEGDPVLAVTVEQLKKEIYEQN